MKQILQKYRHAWVLLYVFLYIPWFFYLERTVTSHYHIIHVALDDYIPFNEYFIIPYLFWFLYVAGTVMYFFFKDKHDFYRLCAFLFGRVFPGHDRICEEEGEWMRQAVFGRQESFDQLKEPSRRILDYYDNLK